MFKVGIGGVVIGKALGIEINKELEVKTMKKTFKEVIADIKEGEVWESHSKYIKLYKNGSIEVIQKGGKKESCFTFSDLYKFTLQRKKVTFTEAFAAYEEGKEIESCVSGVIKMNTEYGESFDREEITGQWYIN